MIDAIKIKNLETGLTHIIGRQLFELGISDNPDRDKIVVIGEATPEEAGHVQYICTPVVTKDETPTKRHKKQPQPEQDSTQHELNLSDGE